jgi:hypothetical protein
MRVSSTRRGIGSGPERICAVIPSASSRVKLPVITPLPSGMAAVMRGARARRYRTIAGCAIGKQCRRRAFSFVVWLELIPAYQAHRVEHGSLETARSELS